MRHQSLGHPIIHRRHPGYTRCLRSAGLLILTVLVAAACGGGASVIEVTGAVMPVPGSNDETSVYMTITNSGDRDDQLLNADTDIAPMTHLHQTEIEANGRTSMENTNSVRVDGGSSVRFAPGGRHLMLMSPEDLQPGETFTLWLNFRHAGTVKTTVKVIDISDLPL